MIENIVARSKKKAVKRFIKNQERGIKLDDIIEIRERRVQGERGSPEYHQSRRLGENFRTQGRANHQRANLDDRDQS